jgi:hypothetical protein
MRRDTLCRTCVFPSSGSCRSHSALRRVPGVSGARKVEALFFLLEWDRYGFHKKRAGSRYAKLVFLHPVGCVGHVVHSGASTTRYIDALFFMLGWNRYGSHKKRVGTRYAKHVFFNPVGSVGNIVLSSAFGAQNFDALFFMLRWDQSGFYKNRARHVMPNLCLASGGIFGSRSAFRCVRDAKGQRAIFHAHVGLIRIPEKSC